MPNNVVKKMQSGVHIALNQSYYDLGDIKGVCLSVHDKTGISAVIAPTEQLARDAHRVIDARVQELLAGASRAGRTLPEAAIADCLLDIHWMENWFGFTLHEAGNDFLHVYCGPHTVIFSKHKYTHRATIWRDGYPVDEKRYAFEYHAISIEKTLLLVCHLLADQAAQYSIRQQIWTMRQRLFCALAKLHNPPKRRRKVDGAGEVAKPVAKKSNMVILTSYTL